MRYRTKITFSIIHNAASKDAAFAQASGFYNRMKKAGSDGVIVEDIRGLCYTEPNANESSNFGEQQILWEPTELTTD